MKKILFTISLLIIITNIAFARERINTDPSAHVKPTNSTEIDANIVIQFGDQSSGSNTAESKAVVPEVEQAFTNDTFYKEKDVPTVGYSTKDEDDPANAQVATIQNNSVSLLAMPNSLALRITYRSNVDGWATFYITYRTNSGDYTNTIYKPIAKGLNILSVNATQKENVTFFNSPNVFCSKIERLVFSR